MPNTDMDTELTDTENEQEKAEQRRSVLEDDGTYDDLDDDMYNRAGNIPIMQDPVTYQPPPPNFDSPAQKQTEVVFKDDNVEPLEDDGRMEVVFKEDEKVPMRPVTVVILCASIAIVLMLASFLAVAVAKSVPSEPTDEQRLVMESIDHDLSVLEREQRAAEAVGAVVRDYATGAIGEEEALSRLDAISLPSGESDAMASLCRLTTGEYNAIRLAITQNAKYKEAVASKSELQDTVYTSEADILKDFNEFAAQREVRYGLWKVDIFNRMNDVGIQYIERDDGARVKIQHEAT